MQSPQVGAGEGSGVGACVGNAVGNCVGAMVGVAVGAYVGNAVGNCVGAMVGVAVGAADGTIDGACDGCCDGSIVGRRVGGALGGTLGSADGGSDGVRVGCGDVEGADESVDAKEYEYDRAAPDSTAARRTDWNSCSSDCCAPRSSGQSSSVPSKRRTRAVPDDAKRAGAHCIASLNRRSRSVLMVDDE